MKQQARVVTLPDGDRILVIDSVIPDDAPDVIREGLARRAIVNGGGRCPCGAFPSMPNRAQRRKLKGKVFDRTIEHEDDCPATTSTLAPAIEAWEAGRAE